MRILSGVQPSGQLHLGNYFGAIKQHISLQETTDEIFIFIADYHALTTADPETIRQSSYEIAATYLALGLDAPDKVVFFRQSAIPELHELAWIFATQLNVSVVHRAHAYKDKVEQGLSASVGLLTYPILMAADILAFRADIVPVGVDQVQHIEIAADIAGSMNHRFKTEFVIPQSRLDIGQKVPGIDGRKMSKSYGNTIPIFADQKEIAKKVKSIITDSKDFKKEALTLDEDVTYQLYSLLATPDEIAFIRDEYLNDRAFGYGHAKALLIEKLEATFGGPFREAYFYYLNHKNTLNDILENGAQEARCAAQDTISKVREAVGLVRR